MNSIVLFALVAVSAVLAAPTRFENPAPAEASLDKAVEIGAKRIARLEMAGNALVKELNKQAVATAELAKSLTEVARKIENIEKKIDTRARREVDHFDTADRLDHSESAEYINSKAEKLDAMKEKSQIEKTERALSKSTEHVDQLQNNVDTMSKQLQKAELSSKEANEHVDTLKEHTSELTQQVDTLKKQGEEVRAVANELRKTVAKDVRRRRDTTLNAVDHLAETLSAKADELVTKADQVKDNIEEVKKSAEKVSSATEQATREIREDSAEVSAISKDLTEHKTENMKVIEATKAVLEKTAEHISEKTADFEVKPIDKTEEHRWD